MVEMNLKTILKFVAGLIGVAAALVCLCLGIMIHVALH